MNFFRRMKLFVLALVLTTGLSSCVWDWNNDGHILVGCLGDSNTDEYFNPITAPTWCSKLTVHRSSVGRMWENVNYAVSGAPIVPIPNPTETCPDCDDGINVVHQFHTMIAAGWRPDVLIIAAGSNDIIRFDSVSTPESVVATLMQIDAEADMLGIRDRWFALVPPVDPDWPNADGINAVISNFNAYMKAHLPPEKIIDLYAGFLDHRYFRNDLVHFNDLGQSQRAAVIYDRIIK